MRLLIILSLFSVIYGCKTDTKSISDKRVAEVSKKILIKYARGFTIEQFKNYKIITLKNAWKNEKQTHKYVLYSSEKPKGINNAVFVKTPIKRIACMSLTHVAFIEKLNLEKSIIALSGCSYVSSIKINDLISINSIKEIGKVPGINYELLVEQDPDILMAFGINKNSNNHIKKLRSLGLNVVLNSEYMEVHPLGKAEWIKFIAAFYDENEKAVAIFDSIERSYLELLKIVKMVEVKPTVFTGMPWKGAWHVPGSNSFQAHLFKDAGATYLWGNDNDTISSVVKSKEIIIDEAIESDYWLNLNSYTSLASVIAYDEKFKKFKSIKEQKLFNNDKALNNKLGNDYWESGIINPHIILKDLIKIFHPELIEHELYYYRKLN